MKVSSKTLTACLLLGSNIRQAVAHPQPVTDIQLIERTDVARDVFADGNALMKRKGGGGGGGKGGGGSSGSSGKGGSGSSSSGSSSSGRGSSGSNSGGATKTGSGVQPYVGGGRYYGGGATTPYTSGVRSPLAGIVPILLLSSALTFWSTAWLYGAYSYPYTHSYTFHNRTASSNDTSTPARSTEPSYLEVEVRQSTSETGANQTKPVICFCGQYAECGCDDNGNTTFLDSLIGDGTYANLNQSLVTVADVNGTSTILINGTLPNGTTASGGTEDAFSAASRSVVEMSGYWVMVALVVGMVYLA